jgi:DNA invertase Pin-like site-specific DNA recombinase
MRPDNTRPTNRLDKPSPNRIKTMALVGYARVSTGEQNLDSQLDALKAAGVQARNIYREKQSGKNTERPQFQRCMNELEEGDVLIVAKMDRLGRSLIDLVNIVQELQAKGVQFKALDKGNMDTTTPDGRMVFGIFATLAEYERELIVERTRTGLDAAKARGRVGGRPKVKADSPKVVRAKDLRDKGVEVDEIADILKVSRATAYRYLAMH